MNTKITISIDEDLAEDVTKMAHLQFISRSKFISIAIEELIARVRNESPGDKLLIPFFRRRNSMEDHELNLVYDWIKTQDPDFDINNRFDSDFYNSLAKKYSAEGEAF